MIRSRCSLVVLVLGLAACGGSDGGGGGGSGGSNAGTSGGGSGGASAGAGGAAMAGAGGSSSGGSGGASAGSGGASAGSGGSAAGTGGSSSAGSGGSSSAGSGGSSSGGSGGGNAGRGGSGGSAGSGGGSGATASGGRGGAGGVTAMMATATINPIGTNTVTGTATFSLNPQGIMSLQISLTNCPPGGHAAHLHEFANCGSNGNDAGNHWVPKGEIIQTITCAADGTANSTTLALGGPTYWTIGGPADSNVLPHAIMIHASPDPSAGARIGCGVATATP